MSASVLLKKQIRGNLGGLLAALLLGTAAHAGPYASGALPVRAPLLITPHIGGIFLCNAATENPRFTHMYEAMDWCEKNGGMQDLAVKKLLDQMEPGGPSGQVQLGYTLLIPLLEMYEKQDGEWKISKERIAKYLSLIAIIQRPVVVYLMGDHFDSGSTLSHELAEDPRNLLAYADGPASREGYWGHGVIPFTLRTDESIPVNRYRFEALRQVIRQMKALDSSSQSLIAAVTLAGELHQQYPGFEDGVGEYKNLRITDYSAASQQEFRAWLQDRFGSIARLNQQLGFTFNSFADIEAPSKDIRTTPLKTFAQHFDAYAGGKLPVFGWMWDPKQSVQKLTLYVNGQAVGPVPYGLGRMDVYRAKPEVTATHTGFRRDIDFRKMAPGKHVLQVVATSGGTNYLIGEREFVVVPRDQSSVADAPAPARLAGLADASQIDGLQFWMDMPSPLQDVYFNPLAHEWNQFRAHQVNAFLTRFYRIAREEGLPAKMLYSHQIVPDINGAWNPVLFASDDSISNTTLWRPGVNVYGDSPLIFDYLKRKHLRNYALPEFNPQQWKNPDAAYAAFVHHYNAGAKFVSPFYLSVIPARMFAPGTVRTFDIAPDNTLEGSDTLFKVIEKFVRQ